MAEVYTYLQPNGLSCSLCMIFINSCGVEVILCNGTGAGTVLEQAKAFLHKVIFLTCYD